MADGSLARRYSRALIGLADDQQGRDRMVNDLDAISKVFDLGEGDLRSALVNPGITLGERRAVLDVILGRVDAHTYVKNFLRLLLDKNRFDVLPDIVREAMALADDHAGRVRAVVTTARKLDQATMRTIQQALSRASGKHVIARFRTNPRLIGGMTAKVGDTVYDASVRSRLVDIHQTLTSSKHPTSGAAEA
jgi:F-type H+-transporting ATPase subunit delta